MSSAAPFHCILSAATSSNNILAGLSASNCISPSLVAKIVFPRRKLTAWLKKLRNKKVRCNCCNYLYKNVFESYAYNLHNSFIDDKLVNKFESADKTKLEGPVNNIIKWLDASQEHSKEDYREK